MEFSERRASNRPIDFPTPTFRFGEKQATFSTIHNCYTVQSIIVMCRMNFCKCRILKVYTATSRGAQLESTSCNPYLYTACVQPLTEGVVPRGPSGPLRVSHLTTTSLTSSANYACTQIAPSWTTNPAVDYLRDTKPTPPSPTWYTPPRLINSNVA